MEAIGNALLPAWLTATWLVVLAGLIGYRLATGEIGIQGLLATTARGAIDPERVQLLLATVLAAGYYARSAAQAAAAGSLTTVPDVPADLVAVMAASQLLYLGGKLGRRLGAGGAA